MTSPSERRRGGAALFGVVGVLLASTMVWKASTAAFTATTSNGVNTFSAGTVALGEQRREHRHVHGPAQPGPRRQGTKTPAPTAGSFDCTGFVPSGTLVTSDLATIGTVTAFASGYGTWAAAAEFRDYRFSYTFASGAGNAYQSTTASITFVWEARNS